MKTTLILTVYLAFSIFNTHAQQAADYAVQLQAIVSESPAAITIEWPLDTIGSGYTVFRKNKDATLWGNAIATLPANAIRYTDSTITVGEAYEYYVQRRYSINTRLAHGYIYAGIKKKIEANKGGLLLLIDQNYAQPLASEIKQLKLDLIHDGWALKTVEVSRSLPAKQVKQLITTSFQNDQLKALFIFGHVSIPYSGGFVAQQGEVYPPDGHSDHGGAWASDTYYASFDETLWTDNLVNDISPARTQNKNIPGDGKFDVNYLGDNKTSIQVGRVDLVDMPAFGKSDTMLMQQYLNKAHVFKTAQVPIIRHGLIDDNWGAMGGEAFAAAAWRDFATMFGDSIVTTDYLTSTKQQNYLFTYGGGAGSYSSCGGIGNTAQFNNDSINQQFTMLFGSYFGDWDSQDNFLRAPLASKNGGLTSVWSGRPHWHFHHMALGENIGFSQKLTQNNYFDNSNGTSGYVSNICPTFISINLMGDPSLRLHMRSPLQSLVATSSIDSLSNTLSWPAVPNATGYLIAKTNAFENGFNASLEVGANITSWVDLHPFLGTTQYMVRPIYLEQSPSGSYYNLGLGATDSAYSKNTVGIPNSQEPSFANVSIYPNPTEGVFTISFSELKSVTIDVYDVQGKLVFTNTQFHSGDSVNLTGNLSGIYVVKIKDPLFTVVKRIIVK